MIYFVKSLLLLACAGLLAAVKFRCDYNYHGVGWFKYHEIPMSWRDARLYCHLQGAMLASPTTSNITNIMKIYMRKVDIFTGIHATVAKGIYFTVNGIPLSEIPQIWADSEPDNKNYIENCLALNTDGKMSDVNCDEPRPFICYREDSSIDVNDCGTPDSEYNFYTSTNKCYKLHAKPRQFHRAYFACAAEGGHLAIINSEEESKIISHVFSKYPSEMLRGNFWKDSAFIGFYNWGESSDWTTIHDQSIEDAGFAKFDFAQPDNGTTGEYCGAVQRNGLLNDDECYRHIVFICEKKPDFPPVCDNIEEKPESTTRT